MWIPEYITDLDSDFRVFHGVCGVARGEFGDLSAEEFVNLAERCVAYKGAMRMRAENEAHERAEREKRSGGTKKPRFEYPEIPPSLDELDEADLPMETMS